MRRMSKLLWKQLSETFDIAVLGSGFAGSLMAMIAKRLGRSVVLLERSTHPRFAIGESSTPLANLLLEELAVRYDLPRLMPLTKWGSWQQTHPEIACGLKRGFTFYHHTFGCSFSTDRDRVNQLLVAASPHDFIADTHWYRPDFDHFFVREAQALGVEYLDEAVLDRCSCGEREVILEGERRGRRFSKRVRFVVDATGPSGFLHYALKLPEAVSEHMPPTQALYTHFTGVRRFANVVADIRVDPAGGMPPYPVDDAAVHHVFDGGWIWVLRFNNGITSAGVAMTDELADEVRLAEGAAAWERLMKRLPTVQGQFAEAKPQFAFKHSRRISFRSPVIVGKRWAMLPSAAGFVDPLLSTGFPLTLLGVARIAEIIARDWTSSRFDERLRAYELQTTGELIATERLVAALYATMNNFSLFTRLSLLYFAAASFSETARRLGRPQLAGSFLLNDHPVFGPESRACFERAMGNPTSTEEIELIDRIHRAIKPVDVAGLGDRNRRNWYPVDAADLFAAAGKLGAGHAEIEELLVRSGFFSNRS